jgi:adenylate cyclase
MGEGSMLRRLAAVIAADVADYATLMSRDEDATLRAWQSALRGSIEPFVAAHRGRLVKTTGDGFLAEFSSAQAAVRCAAEMQKDLSAREGGFSGDLEFRFRMGINLGDIMSDAEDIYGDGVNIAARIKGMAEPGDVLVSGSVYDQLRSKAEFACNSLGAHQFKNIADLVQVWRVGLASDAVAPPTDPEPAAPGATPLVAASPASEPENDSPSIAVLPFDNMSGDPEQEYFADGMTEDLITDLSKISGLLVIARNSVFTYKGTAINVPEVCRELGVRWALEGSVRKAGNRVRVNAQLIDGSTGGHLWADRFDRDLDDIFAVQDEVTSEIVDALKIKLSREDEKRVGRRSTTDVEIYEAYLQARKKLWNSSRENVTSAIPMFDAVLAKDPDFAPALGGKAIASISLFTNQWTDDPDAALQQAITLAERAVAADENEASAHLALGVVRSFQGRREEARNHGRHLLEITPNNPEGHALLSNIEHYAGNFGIAMEEAEKALRVDPHSPDIIWQMLGQAAYMAGDYEKSRATMIKRIEINPGTDTSHLYLAAIYGRSGDIEKAKFEWSEIFRVNPTYSLADRIKTWPYADPDMYKRILEGLEMAGIDHQIP